MRDALLVIDAISTFEHDNGAALLRSFREVHGELLEQLGAAREAGVPVLYVNDADGCWDADVPAQIQRAIDGPGGELVAAIAPRSGEAFLRKRRYSAFDHTPLDLLLGELEVERLLLTGAATEMCIVQTAIDAREHGFKVSLLADACAAVDPEMEALALQYAERIVGARVERGRKARH